ncbi:hypothetical protein BOX15_Mlig032005g1, partial [Macrostomum lignano]
STMAASVPKCPPHQYYYELSKMCDNCPEKCLSGSSTPECERLWSGDFCHPISSSSLPVKMSTSSPSLVTGNSSLITNESISKTGPIVAVAVFSVIALVAIVAAIVALVCRHRHRQRKANEQVDLQLLMAIGRKRLRVSIRTDTRQLASQPLLLSSRRNIRRSSLHSQTQ